MLVHRFLEDSARLAPAAVALVEPGSSTTYAELDRLANRFANLFIREGVRRGDRVVLAVDNCAELVAAYMGTLKAGGVAVPLPAGARSDRLATAIADCTPKVCVVDAAVAHAQTTDCAAQGPVVFVLAPPRGPKRASDRDLHEAVAACPDSPPAVRPIDVDLAAIIYTSGSTGTPRGVMLTHRNIVANTRSIVEYLKLTAADRVMCVLPFYYVYGLSLLHTHLAVGGSIVIDNRFAFPSVVIKAMQDHAVTGLAGVPSTFALLLQRASLEELHIPSLRYVTQAGGAMPTSRILEWRERGPRTPFYVMYGATEASARLTYLDPSALDAKLGSIGRPIPNVEIQVVKDDGMVAAPGEIGELVARGANIARGYWNDRDESAKRFGPLGYRTGDLGYADEDGYLFLVGRRHDMIKVGAHRVGSKEIEDVLHQHPAVFEAAVVATSHGILGEAPFAFVVCRQGVALSSDDVLAFCRSRLPAYKVPVRVMFRAELPRLGGVAKIDKVTLRAVAADAAACSTTS